METHAVAVVGAGAMGSAAAWALARSGREVVVLEQHELGHERGGSHGATRLFRLDPQDAKYVELAGQARQLWRELEAESGDTLLTVTGGIEHGVARAVVDRFRALFGSRAIDHDVLDAREAARRWPGMRFDGPVLFQPGAGRLLADRCVAVLQRLATDAGAQFRPRVRADALRIVRDGSGPNGGSVELQTQQGSLRAQHVVATVGPWAPRLLGSLIELPEIVVTQEQPRLFRTRDASHAWPTFVHWRHDGGPWGRVESYGLLEPGGGVKVGLHATGPVVDPDRRDFQPAAAQDAALVRYVRQWFPGLDLERSTAISCVYDNTARDDFVIDRAGPITLATGFNGQGFKFVPVVGELLRDLVTGRAGVPDRFRLAAHRAAELRT